LVSLRGIVYDGDPGIDDALAILMAVNSPGVGLLGITTVMGNSSVENTTRNTLRILEMVGSVEIPVAIGASSPLSGSTDLHPVFHGLDGLGNSNLPDPKITPMPVSAYEQLEEQIQKYGDELTIVACGPLTNLAILYRRTPELLLKVRQVIVMGGAIACPGNISPSAEFNIYLDPESASLLFESRIPITLVTLDTTAKTFLTRKVFRSMNIRNRYLREMIRFYIDAYRTRHGIDACLIHDAVAMAVAINPNIIVDSNPACVRVSTKGAVRGRTVAIRSGTSLNDSAGRNICLCEEVDLHLVLEILRQAVEF